MDGKLYANPLILSLFTLSSPKGLCDLWKRDHPFTSFHPQSMGHQKNRGALDGGSHVRKMSTPHKGRSHEPTKDVDEKEINGRHV